MGRRRSRSFGADPNDASDGVGRLGSSGSLDTPVGSGHQDGLLPDEGAASDVPSGAGLVEVQAAALAS
ncbi:MAG: hypothetical protein R6T85_03755, partial [Egibacteraceae bacterium]